PRPPRPRNLRLRRRGSTVIVTWRGPAHLRQDDVRVVLGSGEVDLRIHRGARDRVVLRGIRPQMRLGVTVIARDARLRASRPAHARLRPRQKQSSGQP
ncbi:MAG TPA: hypothetical protein VI122_17350, partial [Thermoleophilaceae bacterium]